MNDPPQLSRDRNRSGEAGGLFSGKRQMLRYFLSLLLVTGLTLPLPAAEGLLALFDKQVHDFGDVPIGPVLHHSFTIKNTTNQTLQIGGLRVSCGCVTPSTRTYTIPPGGTGTINAAMDTRRFVGAKQVTIFVLFTQPRVEEVSLVVRAFGRTDISMNPDKLEFGKIKRGAGNTVTTTLTFAGSTQVTEATCESGYVQLAISAPKQTGFGLSYEITASLRSDIPVGNWYTDVWVKTNTGSRLRIPLTVEVEPALTIAPGSIAFDDAKVGQVVKKSIVVKGAQPFKIVEFKGGDGLIQATAASQEARSTHLITVTFTPEKAGEFSDSLEIITDLKSEGKVAVPIKARVEP